MPLDLALSPLEAISEVLQQQRAEGRAVRTLHLIAHGDPGVVWVGDQAIDRAALLANAELLASWGLEQIALWSCHVGADADFIALLEELTGAVVHSSQGWLGRRGEHERYLFEQHSPQILASGSSWRSIDLFNSWPEQFELGRRNKRNRDALPFSTGDTFFGVDDDNDVWQVNPTFSDIEGVGQPFMKALRLYDPLTGDTKLTNKKASNGIAFDKDNDDLFFFYATKNSTVKGNKIEAANGASEPGKVPLAMGGKRKFNIVWWNIHAGQDSWNWVEWADDIQGGFGDKVNQDSPANAVFHGESIWYFGDGNRNLYRLKLEYEQGRPFAKGLVNYELDDMYKNGSYGDLAIREEEYGVKSELILYGSQQSGRFFKLNLSVLLDQAQPPADESGEVRVPVNLEELNRQNNQDAKYSFVYKQLSSNLKLEPVSPPGLPENKKALQLTFSNDSSLLWGQTYEPNNKSYSGVYYNITPGDDSVQASPPLYQAPDWDADIGSGFRDLGGSTDDPAEALPPDFEVNGIERCETEWNGTTAKFQYNITLQDIDIWNRVFLENGESSGLYGPFFADFDVTSPLGDKGSDYFVESIHVGGPDGQEFDERTDSGEIRFFVDPALVDVQPSESDALIKDASVPIVATIRALEGTSLAGDEQAEMQLVLAETGEEKPATAQLSSPKDCFPGIIESIKGKALCDDEAATSEQEAARFLFNVEREITQSPQYYQYQLSAEGLEGGTYEIQNSDVIAFDNGGGEVADGVLFVDNTDQNATGYIEVKGNVGSFAAGILLKGDNFVGNEEIALTLANAFEVSENQFETIASTAISGEADLTQDCILPLPSSGEVQRVEATSACELDGTSGKKDAVFKFEVSFDPVGTQAQMYGYNFEAFGDWSESGFRLQEIVFPDDVTFTPSNKTSGEIVVPAGMENFELDVVVKSNQVLTGEEGLQLTVSNESSEETGSTILNDADCAPTIGEVDQVTGVAACEREGLTNKQRATFSFDVVVEPGDLPQIYDYSFVPSGFQAGSSGDPVEITGIDVANSDGIEFLKQPGREGQLQVDAGVESFRVEVSVTSKGAITGEESLALSLANDLSSASGTASLADHECKQSALLEALDGLGYCSDSDDDDTDLKFFFRASFDPGLPTLYGYELGIDNLSLTADYIINDLEFTDLQGDSVDVQIEREAGGLGTILVGEDVSDVVVSVEANATGEITGQEALTLSIGEPQDGGGVEDGTGLTASVGFDDYLDICDPLGPQVTSINAQVDCNPDDDEDVLVSRFIYDVNLIADNSGSKTYEYSFVPSGFEEDRDDYSVTVIPSEDYRSKDLQSGALQGKIRVAEGVDNFKLEIDIQAGEDLVETESLSLTLADERSSVEATASLATSDCIEQVPDSHLFLLMNNSTSMLSPEPSTSQTSAPTMLEAQNRIAFYSFEQAAAKAGYGFRNINDDSFESFGETSRNAILSNSSQSLARTLQDYELVDDPYDGKKAGKLSVHLITYGYIVDYRREDFQSSNLFAGASAEVEGLNLAQRILLTSTPNKIYGNSIEGNPNWEAYDLPEPIEDDYYPRNWKELGVNASNLYSGTEMLGAFTGLTHLLREKSRSNDIQPDESVAITVATDGRPERRPWWDNRGDQISGIPIPLPESLGGDEITAAGLLYNNDGSFVYNLDNDGVAQWPKMQDKLNKQMDRLAKKLDAPGSQFEVDVIGLGEEDVIAQGADDVVNFPAIYENLFNEQTFDNSGSTWVYNVIEDLPDFFD